MKIMDILVREAVILDLEAETKQDGLDQMATRLAQAEVPHGKMPGLSRLVASFARCREGLDFDSIDGQATTLFFLLVVPEHSGGQHLKALARISRFFRDATFRKRLQEAGSEEDVFRAIEEEDAKFTG
jgi:PTS system nitrogen regulatory IIA component